MLVHGKTSDNVVVNNSTANPANTLDKYSTTAIALGANMEYRAPNRINGLSKYTIVGGTFDPHSITTTKRTLGMPNDSNFDVIHYPTAAGTLYVASTNANDTAAGTGAQTLMLVGLNGDWIDKTEIITLNAQTPVATADSDWFRINKMIVMTAGSTGGNLGDIYISDTNDFTAGKPNVNVVHALAEPDNTDSGYVSNISLMFSWSNAAGTGALGGQGNFYVDAANVVFFEETSRTLPGVWYRSGPLAISQSSYYDFSHAGELPEKSDFYLNAHTKTGTATGIVKYGLVIRDRTITTTELGLNV